MSPPTVMPGQDIGVWTLLNEVLDFGWVGEEIRRLWIGSVVVMHSVEDDAFVASYPVQIGLHPIPGHALVFGGEWQVILTAFGSRNHEAFVDEHGVDVGCVEEALVLDVAQEITGSDDGEGLVSW